MAYSDYGGYAYRDGKRIEARSDATIGPDGDTFGSPGMWPGFAAMIAGGEEEYQRRKDWPRGHAVLGDGPIYVVLYKQSTLMLYRGPDKLDSVALLKDAPPEVVHEWSYDGKTGRYVDTEFLKSKGVPCFFEVDGCLIEAHFTVEDNHYQYVKLTQPDGHVWHGWSGYGVGAGLEDCDYGYSTSEREDVLTSIWPEAIDSAIGSEPEQAASGS